MVKKEIKLLPIKNDYVFKRTFAYEGNEDVLKDLLEAILERKIKRIIVKNPEMLSETQTGKKFILDIKAELEDGTIVDIEMQTVDKKNIEERSTAYISKMISEQLQVGDEYTKLNKSIFIGILDFEHFKRNSYRHTARLKFDKTKKEYFVDMEYKDEDEIASEYIEMHYIELPKYFKENPKIRTKLDEWLYLFSGDEEKMEMVKKRNSKVKKAMDTLEMISLDPKETEMYESVQTEEFLQRISENNFRAEGEKNGERKNKIETAKKLLKRNMEIKEIADITELTEDEINKLKINIKIKGE